MQERGLSAAKGWYEGSFDLRQARSRTPMPGVCRAVWDCAIGMNIVTCGTKMAPVITFGGPAER